jgi:hypothetical protein
MFPAIILGYQKQKQKYQTRKYPKIVYHAFSYEDDERSGEWFESEKEAQIHITYLQKEGLKELRIYKMKDDGENFYDEECIFATDLDIPDWGKNE